MKFCNMTSLLTNIYFIILLLAVGSRDTRNFRFSANYRLNRKIELYRSFDIKTLTSRRSRKSCFDSVLFDFY